MMAAATDPMDCNRGAPPPVARVLIVEDNPADVDLIREALSRSRVDLSVAMTGEEALDRLLRKGEFGDFQTPDLVLLDLNLPGVNGWEVVSEMRRQEELRVIPVIILTSSSAERDIKLSYAQGANCYLTKPDDLASFRNTVNSIESFWLDLAELPVPTLCASRHFV